MATENIIGEDDRYPFLVVGGGIEDYPLNQWPFFEGSPLVHLATFFYNDITRYEIFLDYENNEGKHSWQPENGSNAVVAVLDGDAVLPSWIDAGIVTEPLTRLVKSNSVELSDEPSWLQGDESIDGYDFVAQIDSNLDESLNIGDAHGVAYLFLNNVSLTGRLLWQA